MASRSADTGETAPKTTLAGSPAVHLRQASKALLKPRLRVRRTTTKRKQP
jgi:hypothetical protein